MFKGEKTTVFWVGLGLLGFSFYQFSVAVWNAIYYFIIYDFTYPNSIGGFGSTSTFSNYVRIEVLSVSVIPSLIGGIIFLVIGLYVMKVGVRKEKPVTSSLNTKPSES